MQMRPSTGAAMGAKDVTDPKQVIPAAAKYVSQGLDATGTPEGALGYYFAGPDMSGWGPKTAAYVQRAQSLYPQMTVAAAAAPASPAAPQPSPDFSSRWGLTPEAMASAHDATAPSADFGARWGIQPTEPAAQAATVAPTQTQVAAPTPPEPNTPASTDRYAGWDVPTATAAPAPSSGNPLLSYEGLTHALAPAPNTTYGSVLPFARDNTTGSLRPALPQSWRDLAQGAVDLMEGPTTGTVTPKATMALTAAVPGLMPSPAAGTGATLAAASGDATAPTSYLDRATVANAGQVRDIANQNQLQADAPLSPAFKANPGVTAPQTVTQAAPVSENPLAAAAPSRAPNPLSTNAAPPPAAPGPTASPSEAAEYAGIPDKLPPAPILPPLTQTAADARADQLVQHFSTRQGVGQATPNLVPGFIPTLAQKTADPGLATLERGVQSVNPGPFQLRAEANQKVLQDFTHNLTGSPEDIASAQAQREAATAPLRDAAFTNTKPVDASPVESAITGILAGPDGKRAAVQNTLNDVTKSLHVGGDPSAPLETDPQMLYGVRKNINDLLDPVAQRDKPALQQAARQLMTVRDALDDAIEPGAPGFKNYISTFADQSKPIDSMRYLQSLNLTDANGNLSLPSVDRAVKAITKQQAQPGVQKSSGVSDDQLAALTQLRDTLRTQGASATGKALGSNTFQNLATNSKVGTVTGNPLVSLGMAGAGGLAGGPVGAMAGTALNMGAHSVSKNAEDMVRNSLIERMLNLQGKGDAVFAPKATGPTWKGRPIPPASAMPNPLSAGAP